MNFYTNRVRYDFEDTIQVANTALFFERSVSKTIEQNLETLAISLTGCHDA